MNNSWIRATAFSGDILAIDMHTHINHGSPHDTDRRIGYSADLDDLLLINRAAGIEKMFACTFASVLSTEGIPEENEYMHRLIDQVDCLYQWVVVDPRVDQTLQQAYTVTVTDAEGNPISGVMVQLCRDACYPGVTDASGRAEFQIPEADYKVSLLTVPEGDTDSADTQEYHFETGSKSLHIVLSGNG